MTARVRMAEWLVQLTGIRGQDCYPRLPCLAYFGEWVDSL